MITSQDAFNIVVDGYAYTTADWDAAVRLYRLASPRCEVAVLEWNDSTVQYDDVSTERLEAATL